MTQQPRRDPRVAALVAYAACALLFSWPLPLHLGTHLTGMPAGDTGVYVWNQWVFHHEVLDDHSFPYFTRMIFAPAGGTNLSLHNYTTFQNLLALPLIGLLGVVATFNVVYLLMIVLTAYATFLLARQVTGRVAESWIAGLLFAWSPILVTRGAGHFSLVAAAPLALFLLVLIRADGHERLRDAVALGATVWLAASTDVYYAVYCLMIGAAFLLARVMAIEHSPRCGRDVAARWGLDVLIVCLAGFIAAVAFSGGWNLSIMGMGVTIRRLYNPMLVLTILVLLRVGWQWRPSFTPLRSLDVWRQARFVTAGGIVATAMLSPVLYAAVLRVSGGQFEAPKVYWRSSPPGVDLLAFVLPNPNHVLAPDAIAAWLAAQPNGFIENVASLPILLVVALLAAWRGGWRPSRWWLGLTIAFGLLSLGPFIHVAGINTYVPGPWALLRYVPIAGLARAPGRFSIVAMLGCAILFAQALDWAGRTYPRRRRLFLAGAIVLAIAELVPAPVTLYSAAIPHIYTQVAAAPARTRVLELPFGVRDGTRSEGNFTARSQFFQTAHGKALVGGYLSRVAWRRMPELEKHPVLYPLVLLSEDKPLSADGEAQALAAARNFVTMNRIGFVVIDRERGSDELRSFAIRAFKLKQLDVDGPLELYRPAFPKR